MKTNSDKHPKLQTTKETYKCIYKCVEKARISKKKELKEQAEVRGQIVNYSFSHFCAEWFLFIIIFSSFTLYIVSIFDVNITITFLLFLLLYLLFCFFRLNTLCIVWKYNNLDFEDLWDEVLSLYLKSSELKREHGDLKKARTTLKKSFRHYCRVGEPIKSFITIFLSAIFIGCLSDKDFQSALFSDPQKMFIVNPLGAICLVFLAFSFCFYLLKSWYPCRLIQQAIDQIEYQID
jgi:hypothetical protein